MDKTQWEKAIKFHGHICPGLAIGYRAAEIAQEKLAVKSGADEEIVCITENNACGIDAIQAILGCTAGKGNLIFNITGKHVYNIYSRKAAKGLRLYFQLPRKEYSKEEYIEHILSDPAEQVFTIGEPHYPLPAKARIFTTVTCDICGEGAAEPQMRLQNGKKVCLECFNSSK